MHGITVELAELIAYKRFAGLSKIKSSAQGLQQGMHASSLRGRGMDFADLRPYQAGDEIRHMDWRVTARTGKPHIKLYQEEREQSVYMLIDFSPSMYFGTRVAFKSVIAARLAAMLAWTVVKQGDKLGACLYSLKEELHFKPQLRDRAVLPILAKLTDYTAEFSQQPSKGSSLKPVLNRIKKMLRPGGSIVIISDFYNMDEACQSELKSLSERHQLWAYQVIDPLEMAPPANGQYTLTNGADFLLLNTADKTIQTTYQQWCHTQQTMIKELCKKSRIPYQSVSGIDAIPQLIASTFTRKPHALA